MPLLPKQLLAPGRYVTPEGDVVVTPERLARWCEKFKAMKRAGLQVPVPWEHQDTARPMSHADHLADSAKHNAGFVQDVWRAADGTTWVTLEIPDMGDAQRVEKSVRYVSPELDDFTDADGKEWRDVITHVALTPRPVWHKQKPFGTPPPARLSRQRQRLRFSLANLKGDAMVKEDEDYEAGDDTGHDEPDGDEAERMSSDGSDTDGTTDPLESADGPQSPEEYLAENLSLLAEHGINLPEHTSIESFPRDLAIALYALKNAKGDDAAVGDDLEDLGEADQLSMEMGDELEREQPRVSMSLAKQSQRIKRLEEENSRLHAEREEGRLKRYVKEARCSPATAKRLADAIGKHRLSFAGQSVEVERIKAQLDAIAENPPRTFAPGGNAGTGAGAKRMSQAGGKGMQRPERRTPTKMADDGEITPERAKELAEEQLRNSGMGR